MPLRRIRMRSRQPRSHYCYPKDTLQGGIDNPEADCLGGGGGKLPFGTDHGVIICLHSCEDNK